MVNNIVFVRELNYILKYQPNKNDNSFYKTYKMFNGEKNRQIRFSNHGTDLKSWIEHDYNPVFGININIAFTENGTPTNDCHPCLINQELIGKPYPFSIIQYVYNCQNFDGSEIEMFANAIKNASINGEYIDPFNGVEGKEAIPIMLEPISLQM